MHKTDFPCSNIPSSHLVYEGFSNLSSFASCGSIAAQNGPTHLALGLNILLKKFT
ncbi:hypothetical protein RND71_034097 [Anisodus tanguticus]|uniref:Uncharacterized protein n=1 Tax=Anisodus tanguticus TaxID=243964 RepID=A0AAE1RA12_9SOLA|nr:hypothetical protein RND71_034097 [Anisodus tanguticus]